MLWRVAYQYDPKDRLAELIKTRGDTYEKEYFVYNQSGNLVQHGTKTNEKLTIPIGTFQKPDSKRIYTYDSTGFQTQEILYHNEKAIVQVINIKKYKHSTP